LIDTFKGSKSYKTVDLSLNDYKKLDSKLKTQNLNVLFLSSLHIDTDENVSIVKKITEQQGTGYNFYGFSQNSVLKIWLKNKQNVDIVFLDDAYDDNQDSSFLSIKSDFPELFQKSRIILLSTGQKAVEDKELLKSADTFMKKPLSVDKVRRYLLSI
jgi:hypothetical protein